jgi:hypothetical protein
MHTTNGWYLVHQTGLKSWKAMKFTNVATDDSMWKGMVLEGNSSTLLEKMPIMDYRKYRSNMIMRQDMFNILKYGRFEE